MLELFHPAGVRHSEVGTRVPRLLVDRIYDCFQDYRHSLRTAKCVQAFEDSMVKRLGVLPQMTHGSRGDKHFSLAPLVQGRSGEQISYNEVLMRQYELQGQGMVDRPCCAI